MASLAEMWAQQQVVDPSGYPIDPQTGQPYDAPVDPQGGGYIGAVGNTALPQPYSPGISTEQVLYGGADQKNMDARLREIAAAAGLPADFDWKPYLAAAAQQAGATYQGPNQYGNQFQNWMIPVLKVAQAAQQDYPQIAQVLPQFGEGSAAWTAGEASAQGVRDASQQEGRIEQGVMAASGAFLGGAALSAGGAAAPAAGEGVTVGSLVGAGAPTVAGTATGAGQFVNAAGQALPAAAGAGSALGSGTTAAGTFSPAAQGATIAGAGAGTAASGTALGRLFGLGQTGQDILSVGGAILPAALSAYGSNEQAKSLSELAARYEGYGAPYRQSLTDISADPSKFFNSPAAQQAMKSYNQSISATTGNPAGSPYAQALGIEALYKQYGAERDRLAGFGGLTQYNAAAPGVATGAIGAQGAVLGDIGYGIGNVMNPKPSLADILRQYKTAGGGI